MAHFAKIENNIVTQVLVIPDEQEHRATDFLAELGIEGEWIQTSFNSNIRVRFAGIGDTYNAELDRFEPPQLYASWIWNEEKYAWETPIPMPTDGQNYDWNENSQSWELIEEEPSA